MKETNSWNCFLCTFLDFRYFLYALLETSPTIYWKLDNNLQVMKQPPRNKQQHTNIHKMLPSFCLPTNMGPFKSATRKAMYTSFFSQTWVPSRATCFQKACFFKKHMSIHKRKNIYILELPLFPHYFFYFFGKSLGSIKKLIWERIRHAHKTIVLLTSC